MAPVPDEAPRRIPSTTPVEAQREQLERDAGSLPHRLGTEEGAGMAIGGPLGAIVGGVIALLVLPEVPFVALGVLIGLVLGAVVGAGALGRRARRARSEFADLRRQARAEPPVTPAAR